MIFFNTRGLSTAKSYRLTKLDQSSLPDDTRNSHQLSPLLESRPKPKPSPPLLARLTSFETFFSHISFSLLPLPHTHNCREAVIV